MKKIQLFFRKLIRQNKKSYYSERYRLMIYFAHSTMVMYSKTIKSNYLMTVGAFMVINKDVIKRVSEEALTVMNYELSNNQMQKAVHVYLQSFYFPQSVYETE